MSWPICYLYVALVALCLTSSSNAASVDHKFRNAPGASTHDTYLAIRKEIARASIKKRDIYSANATLEQRWVDATFLKLGHERTAGEIQARPIDVGGMVEITCTECYVKGAASAHLHIDVVDPIAHVGMVVQNFTEEVVDTAVGFADYTIDYLHDYLGDVNSLDIVDNVLKDGPDWEDLELPTFNYTVDIDIPPIPECTLNFTFDGLELYMDLNTILEGGATYELPLFRSQSAAGLYITDNLNLGVFFTVDLILSVEGEIDISSGFHIKLDDGISIEITLFGDAVSDINMPGGQFEFLPVVVESGGVVFSAVLRLGIFAGFELGTPKPHVKPFDPVGAFLAGVMPLVSAGIEVGIFANVAEFITNITFTPDDEECKRNVVQSYQFALGAKAGATVAIGADTWGPMPETSVPVWYTEMASVCAGERPSTPATAASGIITTAPEDRKRQDLTTTTLTKEFIHTGVNCLDVGVINCPANRQNTSQSTETRTIVTAVPEGQKNIAFPTTVMDTVPSPIAFRRNAETLPPTAGSPTSWVPPPPTSTGKFVDDVQDAADDAIEDVKDTFQKAKNNKPLIIGLSVGVGAPVLLGMLAGLLVLYRRHTFDLSTRGAYATPDTAPMMMVQSPGQTPIRPGHPSHSLMSGYPDYKAVKVEGPTVEEREVRSPGGGFEESEPEMK